MSRNRPLLTVSPFQASRQGQLDGLCGLYAIVNALMLISGNEVRHRRMRKLLFSKGVEHLADEGSLADACIEGMTFRRLCRLLKGVATELEVHKRIAVRHRIASNRPLGIEAFLSRIAVHLDDHGPGSVIMNIHGTINHWTVVSGVDATRLHLADSDGLQFFKRTSLTTTAEQTPGCRHVLWPTQSLLLRRTT